MPKILTAEERQKRWDAEDAAKSAKLASKSKPDPKIKSTTKSNTKSTTKKVVDKKAVNTKPSDKASDIDTDKLVRKVKKELSDEFKEATEELKKILQENKINGNGTNGHSTNGHENGAAKKTDTVIDAGKTEFYERLNKTDKHAPIQEPHIRDAKIESEEINDPPPGPGDNTGNGYTAEPLTDKDKKEKEKQDRKAEEEEPINWTEGDIDNIMNLFVFVEALAINAAFSGINIIASIFNLEPFNRSIDEKDIPPLDDFRKGLLRPGIETIANKIVGDWRNPDSVLPIMALFGILDAFVYSKPMEAPAE